MKTPMIATTTSTSEALATLLGCLLGLGLLLLLIHAGRTVWHQGNPPRRRYSNPPPLPVEGLYGTQPDYPRILSESPPWDAQLTAPLSSTTSTPRVLIATALNTCDHPYDEMPLTQLHDHLFEAHFEVGNLLAERNPLPGKWRIEHASDHGLRMR